MGQQHSDGGLESQNSLLWEVVFSSAGLSGESLQLCLLSQTTLELVKGLGEGDIFFPTFTTEDKSWAFSRGSSAWVHLSTAFLEHFRVAASP